MDFNLKQQQWRDHQPESEEKQRQSSAKIPRYLLLESPPPQHHQQQQVAALPLFVSPDSHSNKITSHFSDYPDHSSTPTAIPTRFPRGRYTFSLAQWQELELQALIFRHMAAGASVPAELLQLVKKSLLASSTSPYFFHHYSPHYQPAAALMQAGYWGKGAMDPEPGRCRRTDGKKWRCSRDVVAGHKYCERHMHRGRNRSRKPVEFPPPSLPLPNTTTTTTNNNNNAALIGSLNNTASTNNAPPSFAVAATTSVNEQSQFSLSTSGPSSFQAFQLNPGSSDKKTMFGPQLESSVAGDSVRSNNNNNNNSNRVLMQFFDDWPRSDNADGNNISSTTSLSISTPGNPTSDFLRLSTGNGDELGRRDGNGNEGQESGQEMSWGSSNAGGWGANSMGGPLAEALRSSTNSSSPTSVLHQLRRCSASDTSFVSA